MRCGRSIDTGAVQTQNRRTQKEVLVAQDAILDLEAAAGLGEVGPLLLVGAGVEAQRHDLAQHPGNVDAEDGTVAQHDLAVAAQGLHQLALAAACGRERQSQLRLSVEPSLAEQRLQCGEQADTLGLQVDGVGRRAAGRGLGRPGEPAAISLQLVEGDGRLLPVRLQPGVQGAELDLARLHARGAKAEVDIDRERQGQRDRLVGPVRRGSPAAGGRSWTPVRCRPAGRGRDRARRERSRLRRPAARARVAAARPLPLIIVHLELQIFQRHPAGAEIELRLQAGRAQGVVRQLEVLPKPRQQLARSGQLDLGAALGGGRRGIHRAVEAERAAG